LGQIKPQVPRLVVLFRHKEQGRIQDALMKHPYKAFLVHVR